MDEKEGDYDYTSGSGGGNRERGSDDIPHEKPKDKKINTEELLIEVKQFFNFYKKELGKQVKIGKGVVQVSFQDIASFSHTLAEQLLESPEEILLVFELGLEDTGIIKNPRVRLLDIPEVHKVKIRDIRAKHLNQLICIEGLVRQASDVRPQVVNAKFECPSCGTVISVLQIDKKFREPSRCSCGRKGAFKLLSKDMVDAQRLVIEEAPESLDGGEQPRKMTVFLKEDLVEPKMEEKTTPGSKVRIIGMLKEVPQPLPTGGMTTRFDLAVEANNIIPLEETFEELDISEEDERQIKELAADPRILEKLAEAIAPSIYGYEEIKRALVLQLFSGVKKTRSDGTSTRGDIHVLLIGDPGVAKSIGKNEKILYFNENEYGYVTIEELYNKYTRYPKNLNVLTINQKEHNAEWCNVHEIIKHLPEKILINVKTEHGKRITATKDHSFITLSDSGEIIPIAGDKLTKNSYLPIPIGFHKEILKEIKTDNFNTYNTNSLGLPKKINLDEDFGFFIGIFLSEGNIQEEKDILISNTKREIKDKVILFGKKLGLNPREEKNSVAIASKSLSNLLMNKCYNKGENWKDTKRKGNYSKIKKIPDFSYFAKEEFIRGMLSGIFSGDGRYIKDKTNAKGIELVTTSKELAEGTSDLLFSIGIINRIIQRKYNYKSIDTDYFTVQVPKYMLKLFLDKIVFIRDKLNLTTPIYSYHDLIPCGNLLYSLIKKAGFNKRIGGDRTLASEMRTVKKRNKIGRIRLVKILNLLPENVKETEEFRVLKKISESKIVWSKVEEIEEIKSEKEDVYDLSIPKTNTFVSNGIGVHNSVTLKFISGIAPRGRYVVGKAASGAGITATVVKDEFLKGWALEAGAMVLANKGIVCIDEIDKMDPVDRSAIHEAMEQQTVTISKANVQATLRSETSVLASGNPKFGRFDPYQPIAAQIDIPPTLLNRFDVIFTLRDLPDRTKDEAIASHVLMEHKKENKKIIIERNLFRKYIAYAKQNIKPELTTEATDEIKKFYVDLRNAPVSSDDMQRPIPISARQLEALIRLSEACAKARLSKKVKKEDSKNAIALIKFYMTQVGYDYETKTFDIDKIVTGIPTSQRNKILAVKDTIARLEQRIGKVIPIEELEKELEGKLNKEEIQESLEKLSISGDIFTPKRGFVQKT